MAENQGAARKRKRLSLPSATTDADTVNELIALLEGVTADGRIADDGISALRVWLAETTQHDLPGVELLRTTVAHVLQDGNVTEDERSALYKAIERVLPPVQRRRAKERRTALELVEKEANRAAKAAAQIKAREERLLNRPLASANFMVAGVTHEGRAHSVAQYACVGDPVDLIRDPTNVHDSNAIEVRLKGGWQIGYVPREDAERLAPVMDRGCKYEAYLTKILSGEWAPIPVVDVSLYHVNASRNVTASDVFQRAASSSGPPSQGYTVAKQEPMKGKWIPFWVLAALVIIGLLRACAG
jgi:hypothetical protein